jgi:hypothetical protein
MIETAKKLAANKANAAKSSGPRTEEGKARAAQNGTVHGLRSASVLAPWEDREELERFADAMLACLSPADELEKAVAERIVLATWHLRRAGAYEAQVLTAELNDQKAEHELDDPEFDPPADAGTVVRALLTAGLLPKLAGYQQRIEGSLYRAMHELEHLQRCRPAPKAHPAGE